MRTYTLLALLFLFVGTTPTHAENLIINDVTQLNPIHVQRVVTPHAVQEIQKLVKENKGPISIGGGRYSMGGQIATEQTLFIDMRAMNHVVRFVPKEKEITVQAGATWHDIQKVIDPHHLSVKIMQSYANFTVGGSLSVNVHGRYLGYGPIISSVKSFRIVLADGSLITASRDSHREIFNAAIGGYGGLGIIVDATLALDNNTKIQRQNKTVPTKGFAEYFHRHIEADKDIVLFNGDLYPDDDENIHIVNWRKTDRQPAVSDAFTKTRKFYWLETLAFFVATEVPYGASICHSFYDRWMANDGIVLWRNHEASHDVKALEPLTRFYSTYVLQEYFIPTNRFDEFVPKMMKILRENDANVVNISIRHAKADHESLLSWARQDVFAFVLYYKQRNRESARKHVAGWTRQLIDAALSVEGTYYLPYQIHASREQFHRAYPNAGKFFALKKKLDPENKFRNKLWDAYLQ